MSTECPECGRLWEEYFRATEAQLKLLERLRAADRDLETIRELEQKVDAAAAIRERARRNIQDHEARVHAPTR